MAAWYEMTVDELAADAEAQDAKRIYYARTFYGDEESRQVMLDLLRFSNDAVGSPEAILARIEFYQYIRACCGITIEKEKDVIDAEANIVQ